MKLDQLNNKNILSSFTRDFLVENLEKKRPHMIKVLDKYFTARGFSDKDSSNSSSAMIDYFAKMDPVAVKSNNKKTPFVNDIMQWFMDGKIRLPEDHETTREALEIYLKAKQAGGVAPLSDFDSPGEIRREYADAESGEDKYNEAELVDTIGAYRLYKIDNYEQGAICFKDSGWCVQQESYFNDYRPPFYMVTKAKKRYALLHNVPDDSAVGEHGQDAEPSYDMMDVYDDPITVEMAKPIQKWILQLWPDFALPLWDMIELYPAEKIENLLFSGDVDPVYLSSYAKHQKGGRWKEFEDFLLNGEYDAPAMLHYCKTVLEGRWPQAEQLMLNHKYDKGDEDEKGKDLIQYALHIIDGRWQEAERYMHTAGGMFDYYKRNVLQVEPDAEFADVTAASVLGMTDEDFATKLANRK